MRKIYCLKLTDQEKERLKGIIKNCNSKYGIQYGDWVKTKNICRIILSVDEGFKAEDIAKNFGVGRTTVFNYINKYNKDKNFMVHQIKQPAILDNYEFEIADLLKGKNISSYKAAYEMIKETFNVNITYERTIKFLKSHDFILDKENRKLKHKRSNKVDQRRTLYKQQIIKKLKEKKSYLMEHIDEIERIASEWYDVNYPYYSVIALLEDATAEHIKQVFKDITESKEQVKAVLKNQTSAFY